jgi:hypothetical protein
MLTGMPSTAEPRVRALTSQVALAFIGRLPTAQRDAILADVGDLQQARTAFQFGWIPFAIQIRILDAMRRNLSPSEWHESQRALTLAYLDKPVLRGLLDTAVRVLGLSVRTCCRWSPRAFDALFKDAGALRYEPGASDDRCTLVLEGFPPALFASGTFNDSLAAAFEVIFLLTETEGTVVPNAVDLAGGSARYVVSVTKSR